MHTGNLTFLVCRKKWYEDLYAVHEGNDDGLVGTDDDHEDGDDAAV